MSTGDNCPMCGEHHPKVKCPLVTAFEYYPDGQLKRMEFAVDLAIELPDGDYREYMETRH